MKRLADILLIVAALLLLAACTDDADVYNTSAPSEGNLCVYIPVSRGADDAALGSLSQTVPTYNATIDECTINDLHLYAFPVGDKGGTFLSQDLPSPAASTMLNDGVASYQLQIKPGTYRVYVVANMNDVLKDYTINTEEDLKDVVLSYNPSMSKPGMPVANNIPMIYDPTKAADGKTETITIDAAATTPQKVAANLQFTCVKVCLNLVYDPTDAGVSPALKNNGLQITDVIAERLSPKTNLLWDGKFSNPNVLDDYAKGFESVLYDTLNSKSKGAYYTSWTENSANANVNNENIITVKDQGGAQPPKDPKQKWLFRATYYLPERYVADSLQQSALKIGGKVAGHNNSYNINLGHRKDETSKKEVPTFPRGTYYEIVGHLKTLGNIDLDCVVGVKPWKLEEVDADLTHTTLWVSKTSAEVKSLQNDYIDFKTNAVADSISFGCDTKVNKTVGASEPVIISERDPVNNNRVIFKINPALSIADFNNDVNVGLKGTAKVWIKANNLKKYLDVSYDVTPFFNVDPVDIVIFYDKDNTSELSKPVTFTTNLGGIQFPEGWEVLGNGRDVTHAKSTINIKCDNTNKTVGTFTIKAKTNPGTTTIHTFTVKPVDDTYNLEQQIRVTVRPPVGDYHIYMRAINDLAWYDGGANVEYQHSSMHDEEAYNGKNENYNWLDGWYEDQKGAAVWESDRYAHPEYHFVYIYTQIGETKPDGTKEDNSGVWYFGKHNLNDLTRNPVSGYENVSDWWPGRSMTADDNNPGWYYYSIPYEAPSVGTGDNATGKKTIKPGQTLLIFNNATFLNKGFQSHRFTHHNDPGITLFNYEDREGWYLYDPTSDPYYRVYDKKPTVVDVEYTIYTRYEISEWYVKYGVCSNNGDQFEMNSDNPTVENEFICKDNGNGWYKTILHLKAPLGEYDKNLHLKLKNGEHPLLFDGDSYPVIETVTRTVKGPSGERKCKRYVIEGWYDGTWSWGRSRLKK